MMYRRHISTEYDPENYLETPNEADTCQSYKAEYDSESVSGIHRYEITMLNEMRTQSRLPPRYTIGDRNRLPNQHRIKSYQSIWHPTKPYEISRPRSNDIQKEGVLVQSRRMSLRGETGPFTESHPQ